MELQEIASRISTLRYKKNISAREMSLSIGQNENYINSIENGKAIPSLPGLLYICEYLGISPCEFFDTDNKNPTRLGNIIANLKKLPDDKLETIEKLTEYLTK